MGDSGGGMSPPKKSSIDDIINHITADLQSYDGQYIVLGQPSQQQANQSHLWQQSSSSEMNPPIQQTPIFMPPQAQHNMYYNPVQAHDNYMAYGSMPPHYGSGLQNSYLQHQQYQHPPPPPQQQPPIMRDYGLFANHSEQMIPPAHNNTYANHQLIDNLVGNWVPNQSGTYSPFGNLEFGNQMNNYTVEKEERPSVFADMPRQEALMAAKKPRMVAEVRPMRPSYSAVLTKSPPTPAQNNKSSSKTTPPVSVKGENAGKTKLGKGKKSEVDPKVSAVSSLKRQHSGGSEDPKLSASQHAGQKTSQNHAAQWSDITPGGGNDEFYENEEGKFSRKESGRRSKRNKNKYHGLNEEEEEEEEKEEEEEGEDGEGEGGDEKRGSGDAQARTGGAGKRPNIAPGNLQWGVRETESSLNHRSGAGGEKKRGGGEEKKGGKGGEGVGGKQGRKKEASAAAGGRREEECEVR